MGFTLWDNSSSWRSSTDSAQFDVFSKGSTHNITMISGVMPTLEEMDVVIRRCAKRNPYFYVNDNDVPHVVSSDDKQMTIRYERNANNV
jgi:hypothetical protein